MSEGYTQVAVVQYRHCTTSCHDYRVCCEFQQSVAVVGMITRTEMGGGAYNKILQEYGMDDVCICRTVTGLRFGRFCLVACGQRCTSSLSQDVIPQSLTCIYHGYMPVAVRLTESDM